jgi:hypothetical protein
VDFVIVEFLIAVVSWYPTKYAAWCAVLMSVQLAALLAGSIVIAVWMWNSILPLLWLCLLQSRGVIKDEYIELNSR